MADVRLTNDEVEVLRLLLGAIHIRARTGELGIAHGADRFVSTNICVRKPQKEALSLAFAKLGLPNGPRETP